jgi:hypothetical protein
MGLRIELGDSRVAAGVATLLWLLIVASLVVLFKHRLPRVALMLLAYSAALPIGFLRRRFGRRLLTIADHGFLLLPHGFLGPRKIYAFADVRSVTEARLDVDSPFPSWSLILHMRNGSDVRVGCVSTPDIHEIVAAMNAPLHARSQEA